MDNWPTFHADGAGGCRCGEDELLIALRLGTAEHCSPCHQSHGEPSFPELNAIL